MRVLLLGGTGQVGAEVRALAAGRGIEIIAPGRAALDLQNPEALSAIVEREPWDALINAAAYTEVDRAESEQEAAFALNAKAPAQLAAATARRNIPLIHISTDYVFDGTKGAPYVEGDEVAPLNVYGQSKLAGEVAVRAANPRHVILRTSWVYSPIRKNFVKTILRLARERDRLTIVHDQRGCPTSARDIAAACLDLAARCAAEPASAPHGTYHFAGKGEATWFEFANAIVDLAASELPRPPQTVPIRTADYPTPARRAADTRLDCTAITRMFSIQQRPWRVALAETVEQLLTSKEFS